MKLSSKALGYAQALAITITIAFVVYVLVYKFSNSSILWDSIPWYSVAKRVGIVFISFFACVAVREWRHLAPTQKSELVRFSYAAAIVLGIPVFLFLEKIHLPGKYIWTPFFVPAVVTVLSHARYSVVMVVATAIMLSFVTSRSGESYIAVLGLLAASIFVGVFIKFLFFTEWKKYGSDYGKEKKQNMTVAHLQN
jgi:hypothetical protein